MYVKLLNSLNKLFQLGNIRVDREQCYLGVNRSDATCDCVEVFEPVIS